MSVEQTAQSGDSTQNIATILATIAD